MRLLPLLLAAQLAGPALAGSALAASPIAGDHRLFVAAESADEVYQLHFDGKDLTVEEVIEVGYMATEIEGPHGLTVSPDGAHWFVTMAHGKPWGVLYKYETGTNQLVGECELGLFPATMQLSEDTGLLYVVNFDLHGDMTPSSVSIVDVDAMVEVERTTTGAMPHGSRLSPDGARHYSCAMMDDELIELDAAGFDVLRRLRLGDGAGGFTRPRDGGHHSVSKPTWVQPHPDGKHAYVALNGAHQVVAVDLESWKIVRRMPTDKAPYNLDITPDGTRLVVTHKGRQSIGVWDLETGKELERLATTKRVPHGVVIEPGGRYAFVSSESIGADPGAVDVYDLETLEHVASREVGLQAGGIAYWTR